MQRQRLCRVSHPQAQGSKVVLDVLQQIIYSVMGVVDVWETEDPNTLAYYANAQQAFFVQAKSDFLLPQMAHIRSKREAYQYLFDNGIFTAGNRSIARARRYSLSA